MTVAAERSGLFSWPSRERQVLVADVVAVAIAAALPWSTSATEILVWLWLIAVVPTLERAMLLRVVRTLSGGLPVLLLLLGLAGMLWAFGVPMKERLDGFKSFYKLLFIPLLIAHFLTSKRGDWVLKSYLAACCALLAASALTKIPGFPWQGRNGPGLPVKDYIAQSGEFTVCIFLLAVIALDAWRDGRRSWAAAALALMLLFLHNILTLEVVSRTSLVILPVLGLLFGFRFLPLKGVLALLVAGVALAGFTWSFSPSLQQNLTGLISEVRAFDSGGERTRAGERLEFWIKSVAFVADAPVVGHGTGSIRDQFRRSAAGQSGVGAVASSSRIVMRRRRPRR